MSAEEDEPMDSVDEQAADWVVRQDGGDLGEEERRAFEAWLGEPGHEIAYERHRAVWARYRAMGTASKPSSRGGWRRTRRRGEQRGPLQRPVAASALVASLALMVIGYCDDWPLRLRADFATGVGERRSVILSDGSTVRLDSRSAISFEQSGGRRIVRLLQGAGAFEVEADRAHPFTVETRAGAVTALGTAFAVREDDEATKLSVSRHSVEVVTAHGAKVVVRQGEGMTFTPDRIEAPGAVDVAAATAWTRGKLFVFDRPLGEVVARLARERRVYWTVRGDAASIRVNGVYDLNDPWAAMDVLQRTLKLRSLRLSDRFVVLSL